MKKFPKGPPLGRSELGKIFSDNPFPFLRECVNNYGSIFTLELGDFGLTEFGANGKWVFLTQPEQLRQLFKANHTVMHAGEANDLQFLKLMPRQCSVVIDGDTHLARRRLINKPFMGVKTYTERMRLCTRNVIAGLPDGNSFSLFYYLKVIAKDTIVDTVLGGEDKNQTEKVCDRIVELEQLGIAYEERLNICSELTKLVASILETRRREPNRSRQPDVMSFLIAAQSDNGEALTDAELCDELVALLVGGVGTTATMMTWAFYWILSCPHVYHELRKEINDVLRGGPVNSENVEHLQYLDLVLLETFRISPFLFNASLRLLKNSFKIDGFNLPKGTLVANCSYLLHMNPDIYPDPDRFMPERFKGIKVSPYHWAPFGGGSRHCVGHSFAMHETKVVTSTMLGMTKLELAKQVNRPEFQGAFYAPEGGLRVRVAQRFTDQ